MAKSIRNIRLDGPPSLGRTALKTLEARINSIIKGKQEAVKLALSTLLARGHLLIEDVPGVGKTTLALSIARAINCSFQRIQFTSDMLPSDIIGVSIYNPDLRRFEFNRGPIFANIVLADEINRTTPKTQSALLEAMNERKVTVEGRTHILPEPFMIIATQNPLEYHGTFPLPESQLDRFMMHLKLGYPSPEYEKQALMQRSVMEGGGTAPRDIGVTDPFSPVIEALDILKMQKEVDEVRVERSILDYLMAIVTATRQSPDIRLGASTRGAKFLLKAAKATAYYEGRGYVAPQDVKEVSPYVLGHRILLKGGTNITASVRAIEDILENTPVPL